MDFKIKIRGFIDELNRLDTEATKSIIRLRGNRILDRAMRFFSWYGYGWFYPVYALLLYGFDRPLAIRIIPTGLMAFPIEILLQLGLKFMIRRKRPCLVHPEITALVRLPEDYGFPSGHTAGAFLLASLFGAIYPIVLIPGYLIGLMVGFARVYNGVHYPGDVAAGGLLGIAAARLGIIIIH